MNRRNFTQLGATVIGLSPFMGFAYSKKALPQKPAWLLDLIRLNDKQISDNPNPQITDPQSPDLGAICDGDGIPNALSTGGYISLWAISVSCPESIYYASSNLLQSIEKGAQYLTKVQHSDGTIDLLSSNFHSPPDTAFSVDNVAVAYQLISGVKGAEKALIPLKKYLLKAGEALIVGGIHTPNHRWVVAAALLKLHAIWPDKRYVARAEEWLLEHIDIDPDGQYTEKSAGGYTAIVNRMLIEMAKGLKKPEILDAVRKNLNMTMYYVHPNGEVVTEASNRQDKGTIKFLNSYYYSYRTLALLDQNGDFSAMCKLIDKSSGNRNSEHLNHFLLEPELWKELPAAKSLPTNYVKSFPYSGIVRIRRGQWDTTILSNNPGFLTFHKGNAVLQGMRIAASFFGKGQFQSSEIKQDGNKWILKNALEGPYYQPYPKDKIDPQGDLSKMPRTVRPKSEVQNLNYQVEISEHEEGILVDFDIKGTEGVPVTLELIFRPGGKLKGVNPVAGKLNSNLFADKEGTYSVGEDTIKFSPGLVVHKGINLRGALPSIEAPTVYLTGITPFKHTLKLS
jgi:hypothetical protein